MKKRILLIVTILFISLNILLIINDNHSNIARTVYIPKWTEVKEKHMYDTLDTSGIIDYAEKELIYFNDNDGIFHQFLVQEGDVIQQGDDLYTYKIENYNDIKLRLDHEADKLKQNIKFTEDAIKKVKNHTIQQERLEIVGPNSNESIYIEQNSSSAALQKEQYVIEKEKELEQLKAQLQTVESQLKDLTTNDGIIYVESPFAGKVTHMSTALENPIITIESEELHVVGELTEAERMNVDYNMDVSIDLVEDFPIDSFDGTVSYVSDDPKEMSINKESIYPFHVTFNVETEIDDLLRGYHVDLNVIVNESPNALVVHKNTIEKSNIWTMGHNGVIEKVKVDTGIEMDNYVELLVDDYLNNRIAFNSRNNLIDKATFITPLKPGNTSWKTMFKEGSRKRSIVIGLLAR